MNQDLLYVLNGQGDGGNISGFRVDDGGNLNPLQGSTRPLSGADTPLPGNAVAPADVQFSPDGNFLAVTEKATSLIDIYIVGDDGIASQSNTQPSLVPTPFGTEFDENGFYIVSETNASGPRHPRPDSSSVSTYIIAADGTLTPVTQSIATNQTAACWIVITEDNRFVYDTNTAAGTIFGFNLNADGTLSALNPQDGITADLGDGSVLLDMAIADNFLYVLSAGNGEVNGFRIESNGSLTAVPGATVGNLPGGSVEGLAAN